MKKLILSAFITCSGIYAMSAQTVVVRGRASEVTITETKDTKTTKITCDGWYQNETCYSATNNGLTGTVPGRANLTLQAFGRNSNLKQDLTITGFVKDYYIDRSSDNGNKGFSDFVFVKEN